VTGTQPNVGPHYKKTRKLPNLSDAAEMVPQPGGWFPSGRTNGEVVLTISTGSECPDNKQLQAARCCFDASSLINRLTNHVLLCY
jgi:hypothetical protein